LDVTNAITGTRIIVNNNETKNDKNDRQGVKIANTSIWYINYRSVLIKQCTTNLYYVMPKTPPHFGYILRKKLERW
jgi:hypothetical protein